MSPWDVINPFGIGQADLLTGGAVSNALPGGGSQAPQGNPYMDQLGKLGLLPTGVPQFSNAYANIQPQIQQKLNGMTFDQSGVQGLKDFAGGQGLSPWAQLASQQQQNLTRQQLGNSAAQSNSALQGAFSNLAQRGGLTGGAQERLALQGTRDLNAARQGIQAQGANNQLQVGMQNANQRFQAMSALPGAQSQAAQTQVAQANPWLSLGQQGLQNSGLQNQFGLDIFGQQMAGLGAANNANAIMNAPQPSQWPSLLSGLGGLGAGIGAIGSMAAPAAPALLVA